MDAMAGHLVSNCMSWLREEPAKFRVRSISAGSCIVEYLRFVKLDL
jgi:hypothetical protein